MIKAVGNKYNINFKAQKGSPHCGKKAEKNAHIQIEKLIKDALREPVFYTHVVALDQHEIRLSAISLPTSTGNKAAIYHLSKTLNPENSSVNLTDAAFGKVETLEDSKTLVNKAIENAWRYFLTYYKESLGLRLH